MRNWGSRGLDGFGNWCKATAEVGCPMDTRRPGSLLSSSPAEKGGCFRSAGGWGVASPLFARHTSHRSEPPGRSPRHASRSKLLKREPVPFPDTCHISQGRERPTAAWIVHWGMSQSRWHVNDKKLPCHLPFTRQRGSPASVRRRLPY